MQRSAGLALSAALVLLLELSTSASHHIPPLFHESADDTWSDGTRSDDDLNYRLPNNTEPERYDIVLTTKVHTGERAFSGIVKIDLIVVEESTSIVIHARQLKDFKATIKRRDVVNAASEELNVDYEKVREFLTFTRKTSDAPFPKGSKWELTVEYKGELRTDNGGFYLSTYVDEKNNTHYLATTQFESTNARHAFPCYDEPSKRAHFTITIKHNPTYNVISNMPMDSSKSTAGSTMFQETVNMPTYLIAFIVSDFKWTEGVLNRLPQRIYSRPGTENEQEWALISGMLIIDRLAKYYGVDFALPKIYQAAIPDFAAGAMENWGLATYREEYLLYNKSRSSIMTQTSIASIIAHEYCHQWFGNYVAIKWWTYLWLKEGFATLFSYKALEEAYPEWGIWQDFQVSNLQSALSQDDASSTPRPMTHYVQKPSEISRLYDSVSYAKAASVLHMWEHALTSPVFQRGLHNYLTVNQFNSAVESQLFEAIQIAAKEENFAIPATIADMMSTWSRQGGYPLLTVTRNYNNGSFVVKQEAGYKNETLRRGKSWYIPINYAVQSDADFRNTKATHYLLNVSQITVSAPKLSRDDWLILNKQSTGYYRINYDERNWNLIIDGLLHKYYKIHPRNRAQLMHDAYHLSTSNRLGHDILLRMMTYLKEEDQFAPWSTANSIISTFNRFLRLDPDYKNFRSFVEKLVRGAYDKLGVNDIAGEQHYQKFTRNAVINIACSIGVESCLQETNTRLKELIKDGIEVEPNLQSLIYCNGLKQSGDEFDYVYGRLMNSKNQAERRILISSLGCVQNKAHIKRFIESSIDTSNQLRIQERPTILQSAYSRGEIGLLAAIDFLDREWQTYDDLIGGFSGRNPLDSDIRGMSRYVITSDQEKKLLALVDKVKNTEKVTPTLEASVKANIKSNFEWIKTNRDPVMKWLSRHPANGSRSIRASLMSLVLALCLAVSVLL